MWYIFLENINLPLVLYWLWITIISFQNTYIVKALMHGKKNALSKVISPHCVTFLSFVVSFSYICTFHHIRENKFYTYLSHLCTFLLMHSMKNVSKIYHILINIWQMFNLATDNLTVKPYIQPKSLLQRIVANTLRANIV